MASSSLSSVVSNLVRASMGASVSNTVKDDDLDRHVAELIVREAKKKAERYGQQGIRAYISNNQSDTNAPKANKRFLSSIIKSTDDHNKTVLKAQAQAAQEVKREREEQERRQRRARAEEAAEAERLRRSGRGSKRKRSGDDELGWDRWDGRTAERKKVTRNWESWDGREDEDEGKEKAHRRRRSLSSSRDKDRVAGSSSCAERAEADEEDRSPRRRRSARTRSSSPRCADPRNDSRERSDPTASRRTRRRGRELSQRHSRISHSRSRSRSPRRSLSSASLSSDSNPNKRKRSYLPKHGLDNLRVGSAAHRSERSAPPTFDAKSESREKDLRRRLKASRHREDGVTSPRTRSPRPSNSIVVNHSKPVISSSRRSPSAESMSRSPTPGPHPSIQLPSKMDRYFEESYDPRLDVAPLAAPNVPATGLIDNSEFEGWDAMLELIRARREDKEEKKRLERLGLLPPKDKGKSKKKGVVIDSSPAVADRWTGEGVSIMNIEYSKKGSVREWDMGKEGF